MVGLLQLLFRLLGGRSVPKGAGGQLGGPHPGEAPPGQVVTQQGGPRLVKGLFDRPLDSMVDLLGSFVQLLAGKAHHPVIPAVLPKDQSAHVGERLPPVEGKDDGVFFLPQRSGNRGVWILRPLVGKKGEQHLLGGEVVAPGIPVHIVGRQPELHRPIASRR